LKNKFIATFQNQLGYPRPRFVSSDVYGRNVFGEVLQQRTCTGVFLQLLQIREKRT